MGAYSELVGRALFGEDVKHCKPLVFGIAALSMGHSISSTLVLVIATVSLRQARLYA